MFLRAIILSVEHFRTNSSPDYPKDCKLGIFADEMRDKILIDIFNVITVEEITQENICCLNTGLIYLIFAKRNGTVEPMIKRLADYDVSLGRSKTHMLDNVRKLLAFWKEYYYPSDKDCQSLEVSSRIQFTEWIETVEVSQEWYCRTYDQKTC